MRVSLGHPLWLKRSVVAAAVLLTLSGCEELATAPEGAMPAASGGAGGASVNRDVERPDVFSVTEKALWDGRPSLGGVWVAYPATIDPERVIIRNSANGKSVIGALFRRERDNPGPKIQLSSDAAVALGIVAGTPTEISIVVLRREEVVVDVPEAPVAPVDDGMTVPPRRGAVAVAPVVAAAVAPAAADTSAAGLAAIVEQTLDDVPAPADSAVEPVAAPASDGLGDLFRIRKPYIQVGTFEEETEAAALVEQLAAAGVQAQTQADNPDSPTLWRVISGPYEKRAERTAQLRIIKGLGFTDAFYFK